MTKLSKAAQEVRNAYQREYTKRNKKKVRQYQTNYWERKARELAESQQATTPITTSTYREGVLTLREQGLSIRQIADRLNLSKSKVERLLSQTGHMTAPQDSETE